MDATGYTNGARFAFGYEMKHGTAALLRMVERETRYLRGATDGSTKRTLAVEYIAGVVDFALALVQREARGNGCTTRIREHTDAARAAIALAEGK